MNEHFIGVYPAAAETGIRCESIGQRTATARWTFDESQLRPGRYISGPTMFMLADTALWFAVFSVIGIESMAVTSEMSIRFVRPAQDGDLVARATVDSVSRRRIVGTIRLWIAGEPDRLVAVAQGTYAIPPKPPLS
ncbi:MAG: PaaI family thioesterase [Acidimicrobiia bacterium]|nr:MAG: PaaI family thioesterase [Acidimicrobiia bacterium]